MKPLSKIRKSARGQECQVRIPLVCNFDPDTTILAHLNGGGMGMKRKDNAAAYCCSDCHDYLDHRNTKIVFSWDDLELYHLQGVMRTQDILIAKGLMVLK